jgi:hypothetical protein
MFHWFIFFCFGFLLLFTNCILKQTHILYWNIIIFISLFMLQRLQTLNIMRSHSHLYWNLRLNTHDFKMWRLIFFYTNLYCWLSLVFLMYNWLVHFFFSVICRKLPYYLVLSAVIIDDAPIPYSAKLNNLDIVMSWEIQISNVIQKVYFLLSRLWCTASLTPIDSSLGNCRRLNLAYNSCTKFLVLSTSLIMPGVSWELH